MWQGSFQKKMQGGPSECLSPDEARILLHQFFWVFLTSALARGWEKARSILRCPRLSESQSWREEKAKFYGDGWLDIDPTGFSLVRPPVMMPLKKKGIAGSKVGTTSLLSSSFSSPQQIKEWWDLAVERVRPFLSSLFYAEEPPHGASAFT